MDKLDIKKAFDEIAGTEGVLGNIKGQLAYGYVRVSSDHQAEDGRSGLPRQLMHIHQKSQNENLKIPFDMLYVDDGFSGFEFSERPALTRLRYECRNGPKASHLVIEEIDRLSRNADWHQGYLINEFARRNITIHFFTEPGSELERYIRGYMAQETMKKELERMRLGTLYKAMDGRVTASFAAYGYEITDPKDSYYVIKDEEALVVRMIYDWLIGERVSLHVVSERLNKMEIPCRRGGTWSPGTIRNMLNSEVYKGWYITNRRTYEVIGYNENGRPRRKWRTRPVEEWVWVPVPAIVTEEEWQEALNVLAENRKYSGRRVSDTSNWLLSGLIECSICHYTFGAKRGGTYIKGTPPPIRYYACSSRNSYRARNQGTACRTPYIRADVIEPVIWGKICNMILKPEEVFSVFDEEYVTSQTGEFSGQLAFISQQMSQSKKEKARWDAAYAKGVLELDDYEIKVKRVQERLNSLTASGKAIEVEYNKLQQESNLRVELEKRLAGLRGEIAAPLPNKVKRQILVALIDKIVLDAETGHGIIVGAVPATRFELHLNCESS